MLITISPARFFDGMIGLLVRPMAAKFDVGSVSRVILSTSSNKVVAGDDGGR